MLSVRIRTVDCITGHSDRLTRRLLSQAQRQSLARNLRIKKRQEK